MRFITLKGWTLLLLLALLMIRAQVGWAQDDEKWAYCGPTRQGVPDSTVIAKFNNGTLTVSGIGAMCDWASFKPLGGSDSLYVFSGMSVVSKTMVKKVVIEDGVTSVGKDWFSSCVNLLSVSISNSVVSIGERAFVGCNNLTSVILGSGLVSIGRMSFRDCNGLVTINIQEKVTYIESEALAYCENMTSIIIPNSVTSIGFGAFRGCMGLVSIKIGSGVTKIDEPNYVFESLMSLESIDVVSENPKYCSEDGVLFNKDKTTLIQYPIGNRNTSYSIPRGVDSIASRVFQQCENLTSVTIPDGVRTIGPSAFEGCSNLHTTIPQSVAYIGSMAFRSCESLSSITIPDGVKSIENQTFGGCRNLVKITIPNSVTDIKIGAFGWCSRLETVTIGNSVKRIGYNAFGECDSLKTIISLNTVPPDIDEHTFYSYGKDSIYKEYCLYVPEESIEAYRSSTWRNFNCINSTDAAPTENDVIVKFNSVGGSVVDRQIVSLNNKVARPIAPTLVGAVFIGWYKDAAYSVAWNFDTDVVTANTTLYACWRWDCGEIPGTVSAILREGTLTISGTGNMAKFATAAYLDRGGSIQPWYSLMSLITKVVIEDGVTSIGEYSFNGCRNLTSVSIPTSVTSIEMAAFGGCDNLTSITIPNGILSIKAEAFSGCHSLTSVTISASVTSIGFIAFSGSDLKTVISLNAVPPTINADAFTNAVGEATCLYVPENSIEAYRAAVGWNKFGCIKLISEAISVATPARVIPTVRSGDGLSAVSPVPALSAEFAAGPNPAVSTSRAGSFFRSGASIKSASLSVYDASGNAVRRLSVKDIGGQSSRKVASWDLRDAFGRPVSAGTYLVRGAVVTRDGSRESVGVVVGVR
ncbi:hypothetical protein R80B4_02047 [Fibrobacteres bacterium R8-0-B4]